MNRHKNDTLGEWVELARIDFEEDLYRLMEEQELSQADLAKAVGVSPAFISKVLHGSTNYTLKTMAKLGRALGASLHVRLAVDNEEVVRVVSPETARLLDDQGKTCCPPAPGEELAEVVDLSRPPRSSTSGSARRRQG
jgi:transcriptional regulator with XRE-family HTH domain